MRREIEVRDGGLTGAQVLRLFDEARRSLSMQLAETEGGRRWI